MKRALRSKPGILLATTLAASAFLIYLYAVDAWALRLSLVEQLFGPPSQERPSFAPFATFFVLMLGWLIVAVPLVWGVFAVVERVIPKRYTFTKTLTDTVFMTAAALFGIMAGVHQLIMLSQEGSVYLLHAFVSLVAAGYSIVLLYDAFAFLGLHVRGGVMEVRGLASARRVPLNTLGSLREERGRLYVKAGEERLYLPYSQLVEVRPGQTLPDWFGPLLDPERKEPLARYFLELLEELDRTRARPLDEEEEAARRAARAVAVAPEPAPAPEAPEEEEEEEEEPPVLGAPKYAPPPESEPERKKRDAPKARPGGVISLGAPPPDKKKK